MNILDFIILGIVAVCLALAIIFMIHRKAKGRSICCGCCDGCCKNCHKELNVSKKR